MKIGVDQRNVTPPLGTALAGFAMAGRNATDVFDDLYVTTMLLEHGTKRAAIVCADVIGFGTGLCGRIKAEIGERFHLGEDEILLSASHTHSGPQTCDGVSPLTGLPNPGYLAFFQSSIMQSLAASRENLQEVELYAGVSQCTFGVNRRRIVDGRAQFAPNEAGAIDRDVRVVKFVHGSTVKAILYSYACHPSTVGTTHVTADFPGWARKTIGRAYPGAAVFFLQGCCGNIRVKTAENGKFRPGTMEDVTAFGEQLGSAVVKACGEGTWMEPCLATDMVTCSLPLEKLPSRQELTDRLANGSSAEKAWAERTLAGLGEIKPEIPYAISKITLGRGVEIVAFEGEVCVEYGLRARELAEGRLLIPAAYCNRTPGYIPTRRMLAEGGYEPDESGLYYLLPARFDESVEDVIAGSLRRLLCAPGR